MGARGQGRGDEVHHHHLQAPRRVRHFRLEGLELRYHGRHAVPARRRQGACRGGASGQPQVRGLLLDHGLASPGRARAQLSRLQLAHLEQSEFRPLCRNVYEAPAQGAAHQYPDIDVLWFDGEWIADWSDARGRDLYNYVRAIRPGLIVNNRVGHTRQGLSGLNQDGRVGLGDFGTPEQRVPPEGLPGVDWETCMTMNDTWGFKSYDDDWKDTRTLVRTLIDVASKGGNFLLNVGPTAEGRIPAPIMSRLHEMGEWLARNGEAVYGTTVSPYGMPAWGRYTDSE